MLIRNLISMGQCTQSQQGMKTGRMVPAPGNYSVDGEALIILRSKSMPASCPATPTANSAGRLLRHPWQLLSAFGLPSCTTGVMVNLIIKPPSTYAFWYIEMKELKLKNLYSKKKMYVKKRNIYLASTAIAKACFFSASRAGV